MLLRDAKRLLGDSLRTGKEMEAIRAGSSGLLRVGVLRAAAPVLVPRAILRCRREAPRLQIRLYEDSLDNLLPALRRHEPDCVIGHLHGQALGRSSSPRRCIKSRCLRRHGAATPCWISHV